MKLIDVLKSGETVVFGHRGANAYAPMNTIPAFEMAADQGAIGVELDVHHSKDGHAVLMHDFTIDATTNGAGKVIEKTLAELKDLDAGSWKDERFTGVQIPTLDEVFEAVGQRLFVNVEIKSMSFRTDGVEALVAQKIAQFGMKDRVIVSSFNPLAIRRFQQEMPDVLTGYLTAPDIPFFMNWLGLGMRYDAYHPDQKTIDAALMAKHQNHFVNTWTVNDAKRALELRDLGVNVIITDYPDVMIDALAQ